MPRSRASSPHHRRPLRPWQQLLPAVVAAVLSVVALGLAAAAGADCAFLRVVLRKVDDAVILVPDDAMDSELVGTRTAYVGILSGSQSDACLGIPSIGYDRDKFFDRMWQTARIFFILGGLCLGSLSTILAWSVMIVLGSAGRCGDSRSTHGDAGGRDQADSVFKSMRPGHILPRRRWTCCGRTISLSVIWKILSTMTALTAVMQVPVFLMFESRVCAEFAYRQTCELGSGAFLLISSTVAWVTVTLVSQCLDLPSREAMTHAQLAWRVSEHLRDDNNGDAEVADRKTNRTSQNTRNSAGGQMMLVQYASQSEEAAKMMKERTSRPPPSFQAPVKTRGSLVPQWLRKIVGKGGDIEDDRELLVKETVSMNQSYDNEDGKENQNKAQGVNDVTNSTSPEDTTQNSIDSRLVLRVSPDGKLPNDETPSLASFDIDDLDSIVRLAEEGRLDGPLSTCSRSASPESSSHSHSQKSQVVSQSRATPTLYKQRELGPKYFSPSQPSQAEERVTIIGYTPEPAPVNSRDDNGRAFSPGVIRSSYSSSSVEKRIKKQQPSKTRPGAPPSKVGASTDHTTVATEQLSAEHSSGVAAAAAKKHSSSRLRSFTKKIRKARRGYTMLDDEMGSDDEFISPPLEVNIVRSSVSKKSPESKIRAAKAAVDDSRMPKYKRSSDRELMDNWKELHKQNAEESKEESRRGSPSSELGDGDTDIISQLDENPMSRPIVDAYHNDPEPVYYSSDDDDLSMSSHSEASKSCDDDDDNSTLSSASGSGQRVRLGRDRSSRHSRNVRQRNNRKRGTSVCSLRSSRSLIEDVINEETVQDLIDESASEGAFDDGENKTHHLSIKSASYALTRTFSYPETKKRSTSSSSSSRRLSLSPLRKGRHRRSSSDNVGMQNEICDRILQGGEDQDKSSSDENTSLRSRKARKARIRRLQQQKREALARKEDIVQRSRTPSPVLSGEEDAEYILDADLLVLKQRRPAGAEYGEDEASL